MVANVAFPGSERPGPPVVLPPKVRRGSTSYHYRKSAVVRPARDSGMGPHDDGPKLMHAHFSGFGL